MCSSVREPEIEEITVQPEKKKKKRFLADSHCRRMGPVQGTGTGSMRSHEEMFTLDPLFSIVLVPCTGLLSHKSIHFGVCGAISEAGCM